MSIASAAVLAGAWLISLLIAWQEGAGSGYTKGLEDAKKIVKEAFGKD